MTEILDLSLKFVDKAHTAGKPFFLLAEPDPHARRHHLSQKYRALRTTKMAGACKKPAWLSSMTSLAR